MVRRVVGAIIRCLWMRSSQAHAKTFMQIVASALIAGESIFIIVNAVLAVANVNPPMCMTFVKGSQAAVAAVGLSS